jgi:hypothetical protein
MKHSSGDDLVLPRTIVSIQAKGTNKQLFQSMPGLSDYAINAPKSKAPSAVRCSGCGHYGHLISDCKKTALAKCTKWIPKWHNPIEPSIAVQDSPAPDYVLQQTLPAKTSITTMANFPVNPLAFLPNGMTIDQGPADRKVRSMLVVDPVPPLQHDSVLIIETNRFIPIHLVTRCALMLEIYSLNLIIW